MRSPNRRGLLLAEILFVLCGLWYGYVHRMHRETLSIADLTPVASGPGIVVCEPVVARSDAGAAAFGAGCARWLQFEAGGQGELGKTPLWPYLERVPVELGRSDLRLSLQEAPKLASILGVTHAAIGTLSGSPARSVLSYRLVTVPGGKAVGAPLQITGSQAQILAQLPAMARRLAARLGVGSPRLPAQVGARPEEITFLGSLPVFPLPENTSPLQARRLEDLAQRLPLAGMLFLKIAEPQNETTLHTTVTTLARQAPDNALAFGQIGYVAPERLPDVKSRFEADLQRFPNNYLFAMANVWQQRERGDITAEQQAAAQVVRCASADPDAWLTLGTTLDNETKAIRYGRYASQLSRQEWQRLRQLYPQWLQAVSRATELDPHYGKAWLRVATAACFNSQDTLADEAFWKALRMDWDQAEVCHWGLQMYQPKWLNDSERLQKVARIAVRDTQDGAGSLDLVNSLMDADMKVEARRLLAGIVASNRARIARAPDDTAAYTTLVTALREQGDLNGATDAIQQWIAHAPADARPHYELGNIYDQQHRWDEAQAEYRTVLGLDPEHQRAHYDLAYDFKMKNQLYAAEQEMRKAIEVNPRFDSAHFGLAEILAGEGRMDDAAAEYQEAIHIYPDFATAYQRLCQVYTQQHQYPAAIRAGEMAVMLAPEDATAHGCLAVAYGYQGDNVGCEREARAAIRINPNDMVSHENRGDALIELGRKEEAQAEWRYVLQTAPNSRPAQEATQMLAKYP